MTQVLPQRTTKVKIGSNTYEVGFPNTGEFIDIEVLKAKISQENYSGLIFNPQSNAKYATLLVDMIAVFNVMIPELKNDLNVKHILSMSMVESKQLVSAYQKQYMPFFESWIEVLNRQDEEPEEAIA